MTTEQRTRWTAYSVIGYPEDVAVMWRGVFAALEDGLRNRNRLIRRVEDPHKLNVAFTLHATDGVMAKDRARLLLACALGGTAQAEDSIRSLFVISSETLAAHGLGNVIDMTQRRAFTETSLANNDMDARIYTFPVRQPNPQSVA